MGPSHPWFLDYGIHSLDVRPMSAPLFFLLGVAVTALFALAVVVLVLLRRRSGTSSWGPRWIGRLLDGFGAPSERRSFAEDLRWLEEQEAGMPPRTVPITVQVPPPPEDFLLEVRAGAVSPPALRRQRLSLDAGGVVTFEHHGPPEDPGPVEHVFYLGEGALQELVEEVRDSGFLKARGSRAKDVRDGDFLLVRARVDGQEHQVSLVNTFEEHATAVVRTLNNLLPETMRVTYSLLGGPEPPPPGGVPWP